MKSRYTQILSAAVFALSLQYSCSNASMDSWDGASKLFVSKDGSDANDGSEENPFLTIQKAADSAQPGDVITVGAGVYRESVVLKQGGESEEMRITFQAADGADVRILGSEQATGWSLLENETWEIKLDTSFFDGFNPFSTFTRHPEPVGIDESGDGWGWLKYGRWTHLGDVIIDGEGLTEKATKEEVMEGDDLTWFTSTTEGVTTIVADFGNKDPNDSKVEINSRTFAFHPDSTGLSHITIKGFTIMNIANHWAPPTVYQPAAIWTNGGHHWTIEDNIIMYAQGAAISLGIPNGEADQNASGYHIVRNNVIIRCGQGGTTGQLWANNSEIYGNHIEDINYREEFGGWETAGIKHHNTNNLLIRDNFIRGVYTMSPDTGAAHGIWNDYRNKNWRVSQNVVMNVESHAILTEALWEGPNLYDNNVIINGSVASYSARGDEWAHNLFVNSAHIWDNQPWGDRPGLGDFSWLNNIFVGKGLDADIEAEGGQYDGNVYLDGAAAHPEDLSALISDAQCDARLEETEDGLVLILTLDKEVAKHQRQLVNTTLSESNLEISTDFFGENRASNQAGPFTNLQIGTNEVLLYQYPELYRKALGLVGN